MKPKSGNDINRKPQKKATKGTGIAARRGFLKRFSGVVGGVAVIAGAVALFSKNIASAKKEASALLLSLGAIDSSNGKTISIIPTEPRFVVLGTIAAKLRNEFPFVRVNVDTFTLRVNGPENQLIKSVRLGIAHHINEQGNWQAVSWSEANKISLDLEHGATKTIDAFQALIPVDQLASLKNFWIVLEVGIRGVAGGDAYTYAHSKKDIFPQ